MSKTVSPAVSSASSITHQAVMGPADLPWQQPREADRNDEDTGDNSPASE